MINTAIILGDHIQSLGVSRIASRAGLEVYLFNSNRMCVTYFSNTCNRFFKYSGEGELLEKLLNLNCNEKPSILIPTNDKLVWFVAENYDKLDKKFHLSISNPEIISICYNKRNTYQTAKQLGIPIPDSFFPNSSEALKGVENSFRYPVIIKPAIMHSFYENFREKVFLCKDRDELLNNYNRAIKIIPSEEIIVQEFLVGGAKNLFSYCSFCINGKPLGSFVANRLRQKPMDFGISTTFAKTVVNERIEKLAEKFLKGIDYFGLCEVEFMYDSKADDYKLIEINPRTWKWHTISNKVGINLIQMLIDYFNNKEIQSIRNDKENIGWIERVTDTYVVFTEILKRKMRFRDYLASLSIEKEYACFDKRDPLPAIFYLILLPYLFITR